MPRIVLSAVGSLVSESIPSRMVLVRASTASRNEIASVAAVLCLFFLVVAAPPASPSQPWYVGYVWREGLIGIKRL